MLSDNRSKKTKSKRLASKSHKSVDVPWSRLVRVKATLPKNFRTVMMSLDMDLLFGSDSEEGNGKGSPHRPIFLPKDFERQNPDPKIEDYRLPIEQQKQFGKRLTELRNQAATKAQQIKLSREAEAESPEEEVKAGDRDRFRGGKKRSLEERLEEHRF